MPERKTIAKKHIGKSWCPDCEDVGFNYALTEVEAVLPQMLALAEKRGAEGAYDEGFEEAREAFETECQWENCSGGRYCKKHSLENKPLIEQNPDIEQVAHNIRTRIEAECFVKTEDGYKFESSEARKIAFEEIQTLTQPNHD